MKLSEFNYQAPIHIRFSDIDMLGHVNNAIYLTYMEYARLPYFEKVFGELIDWKETGLIIAKTEVNYKRPIYLKDNLIIGVRTKSVGDKSFTTEYGFFVVNDGQEVLVATGEIILVCINYLTGKTFSMPDVWKNAIKLNDNNLALNL